MKESADLQLDETDTEAQEAQESIRRKQQIEDLKWLMAHPQGRRIATRMFEKTGIRRTPFNTNGSTMAFNAGMQNVGLWLEAEIVEASPDGYMRLLKEFAR